jgi:hypothetical protein
MNLVGAVNVISGHTRVFNQAREIEGRPSWSYSFRRRIRRSAAPPSN